MSRDDSRAFRSVPGTLAATLLFAVISLATLDRGVRAAELAEQAHSLKVVPADAALYSATLRLREQYDIFRDSETYDLLMQIPLVQMAKQQVMYQWTRNPDPNLEKVRDYIQSDEGQECVELLKEMVSDELFMYAGNDAAEAIQLLMELNGLQRSIRIEVKDGEEDTGKVASIKLREILEKNPEQFKVPTLVFGFRIKDAKRATAHLDLVHANLRKILEEHNPELAGHLQRDQIAGQEFLTLRVDGSMIPWDQLREDAEDVEEFDEWKELVSDKTAVIAIGVIDEFLLVSFGASTDHLERVGQGPFLTEKPEIKRLEKHAGERIVSLAYVSESLAQNLSSPEQTKDDILNAAEEALAEAEIDEEQQKPLLDDIRELDLSRYMAKPGSQSAVAFITPRGYEAYQYNATTRPMQDSSQPLSVVNHVGGKPMFFVATRSSDTVEDYDAAVKWLRQFIGHIENVAKSKVEPEQLAEYEKYRDRVFGLLKRINTANREHLYPGFADNQGAIVIDVAAKSKRWIEQMPKSPTSLPMFDIALVASVSDVEQVRKGAVEYFRVLRDAIALAREINPEDMPEFKLRQPQKRDLASGDGELHVYPLPKAWSVDDQLAPNAGLTEKAAVLSLMPATTERLLKDTPVEIDTSLDMKRPAAVVMHFNFEKFINAVRPWISYGIDVGTGKLTIEEEGEEESEDGEGVDEEANEMSLQLGFIVPQIEQFLDVATAFRSASSITYEEDGIWVTHSETHIQDAK